LVRDAEGQKMSKSRGNVIDPLSVIDQYGADAFRYTLAALAAQGRDIRLSEERIQGYRHFMNKIWNAARFTLLNLEGWTPPASAPEPSLLERWMVSRLSDTVERVRDSLDAYKFNEAAHFLYQFLWHEFCDWYVECAKVDLHNGGKGCGGGVVSRSDRARFFLHKALGVLLRLLHPFAPFVSEEIWALLPGTEGGLVHAPFPRRGEGTRDLAVEKDFQYVLDAITGIRTVRGEMNVPPSARLQVRIVCGSSPIREVLADHEEYLRALAGLESLEILEQGERPAHAAVSITSGMEIYVPLRGIINFEEDAVVSNSNSVSLMALRFLQAGRTRS